MSFTTSFDGELPKPWEMTRQEYFDWVAKHTTPDPFKTMVSREAAEYVFGIGHQIMVEEALRNKWHVPKKVLDEYPDLKPPKRGLFGWFK